MVVGGENTGQAMRRSTRVPADIPMRVRSLDPGFDFEAQCRTLLVNAQGCGFQCSRQLPVGIAVLFTIEGRQATATVLNATSLGEGSSQWVIGAKLHQSGNFWGLPSPPPDWSTGPAQREAPSHTVPIDQYVEDKVTAIIQRQTEHAMAALRSEIERLVDARETDLLARVVRESSATSAAAARMAGDQESARLQQAFDRLSQQFYRQLEEHAAQQAAMVEQRLNQVQVGLTSSAQGHFAAVAQEVVTKMQLDAKRLSDSAIAQWHSAFEQTLQMLPELVRQNLKTPEDAVTLPRH